MDTMDSSLLDDRTSVLYNGCALKGPAHVLQPYYSLSHFITELLQSIPLLFCGCHCESARHARDNTWHLPPPFLRGPSARREKHSASSRSKLALRAAPCGPVRSTVSRGGRVFEPPKNQTFSTQKYRVLRKYNVLRSFSILTKVYLLPYK